MGAHLRSRLHAVLVALMEHSRHLWYQPFSQSLKCEAKESDDSLKRFWAKKTMMIEIGEKQKRANYLKPPHRAKSAECPSRPSSLALRSPALESHP